MIDIVYGKYIPVCDTCGEELSREDDFYGAVQAKKDAGWKTEKYGIIWVDTCNNCQEEESRR